MSRTDTRERILRAAMRVAARQGSGNVSLDAVAAEAGVSKGGLLYHFPSKIALMRGIVSTFVADFEAKLEAAQTGEQLIEAYVNLTVEDCARQPGDSAAILTALAEDPELLAPVKRFKRRMLDRLEAATGSPSDALIVFLAVEGLRSLHLFDFDILSEAEKKNMAALPSAITGLKLARPKLQPVGS